MSRATDPLLRQHTDSLDLHLRQCRNLSDLRLRLLCSLEAMDAAISERVFTGKRQEEFIKYLEKLRSEAIIEWKNDELKKAYEQGLTPEAPKAKASQ